MVAFRARVRKLVCVAMILYYYILYHVMSIKYRIPNKMHFNAIFWKMEKPEMSGFFFCHNIFNYIEYLMNYFT